jgi:hypothetical protein
VTLKGGARIAGAAQILLGARSVEDEIRSVLCLGSRVDQKLTIIAKLLQPASNLGGLIFNNRC